MELAKDWRTDRMLRKLEALLIVADATASLLITGNGDVIEQENDLIAIGSGGAFAQSAARALAAAAPTAFNAAIASADPVTDTRTTIGLLAAALAARKDGPSLAKSDMALAFPALVILTPILARAADLAPEMALSNARISLSILALKPVTLTLIALFACATTCRARTASKARWPTP